MLALEIALLGAAALLARLIQFDHAPHTDELNHMLAASSLLEDGSLLLAEGGREYTRGLPLTYAVAAMFRLFGESLVVARIPALVAGVALVLALFVWVRARAGRIAGWTAALLLCFSPIAIYQSQQVRFYTLQALLLWIGAAAVYRLSAPPLPARRRAVGLGLLALFLFLLALQVQILSAVVIAAVLLWAVGSAGPAFIRSFSKRHHPLWLAAGMLLTGGAALYLAVASGAAARAYELFNYADYWAEPFRGSVRFYHWLFLDQYATLWTLFPLMVLVAATRHPRPALFCTLVFAFGFTFHSFAAWKQERYLFAELPFFFGVCGIAAGQALPWMRRRVEAFLGRAGGPWATSTAARRLTTAVLAIGLLFAAAANGFSSYTVRMWTVSDGDWSMGIPYRGEADWPAAAPLLHRLEDGAAVVLSSSELKSLYFLDRLDFDLASEEFTRTGELTDSISSKSGRLWVRSAERLEEVMRCYPSGLAIVEQTQWRSQLGVAPETADYLQTHADAVPVSPEWRLRVFRWNNPRAELSSSCPVSRWARTATPDQPFPTPDRPLSPRTR